MVVSGVLGECHDALPRGRDHGMIALAPGLHVADQVQEPAVLVGEEWDPGLTVRRVQDEVNTIARLRKDRGPVEHDIDAAVDAELRQQNAHPFHSHWVSSWPLAISRAW